MKPSLNPGTGNLTQASIWPPYGNAGFQGDVPPVITSTDTLPLRAQRQPNNISRATPIPLWLQQVNLAYQKKYEGTPLSYYQMVNAQHAASDCTFRETRDWSHPKVWQPVTCPQPNVYRFINTALESYTQLVNPFTAEPENYSCKGCHSNARPCGFVQAEKPLLSWRAEFEVLSFLLSKAQFRNQPDVPDGYSCNNPATQPPSGHSEHSGTFALPIDSDK